jgi:protein TonB
MHQRRLALALAASICFHVLMVAIGSLSLGGSGRSKPAIIEARLRTASDTLPVPEDGLLKNTLDNARKKLAPPPTVRKHTSQVPEAMLRGARQKLSAYQFYPPEAAAQGMEGEVRLLLTLDRDGNLLDVRVAASSGYAILDDAAVRAAKAMRSVPNAAALEMILPVVFQLE